jgi:hypothetical protein
LESQGLAPVVALVREAGHRLEGVAIALQWHSEHFRPKKAQRAVSDETARFRAF